MKQVKSHRLKLRNFELKINSDSEIDGKEMVFVYHELYQIMDKLPENSNMKIVVTYDSRAYQMRLITSHPEFGCDLRISDEHLSQAAKKMTELASESILNWKSKEAYQNFLAPYEGGYPSFYFEKTG